MSAEDPSLWSKIAAGGAAMAATLAGIVWNDAQRRVAKVEEKIDGKADKAEMDRQRDNVEKLFEECADIRKDMNGGFQSLRDMIHQGHIQIMTELAKKADR